MEGDWPMMVMGHRADFSFLVCSVLEESHQHCVPITVQWLPAVLHSAASLSCSDQKNTVFSWNLHYTEQSHNLGVNGLFHVLDCFGQQDSHRGCDFGSDKVHNVHPSRQRHLSVQWRWHQMGRLCGEHLLEVVVYTRRGNHAKLATWHKVLRCCHSLCTTWGVALFMGVAYP